MRDDGEHIFLATIKKGLYVGGTMKKSPILELWNCAPARKRAALASAALRKEHEEEMKVSEAACPSDEDVRAVQNLLGR